MADHTLVLAITPLNFFMFTFLNFAFKDSGSLWLIEASDLEDLCRVEPRIGAPPHHRDALGHPIHVSEVIFNGIKRVERRLHLVDGNTTVSGLEGTRESVRSLQSKSRQARP